MKAQSNVISVVIIAGIVIALVGGAYVWAVPMIEKRITITDYNLIESFMLDLNKEIIDIANTGSGEILISIPKGDVEIRGLDYPDTVNNTITIDFRVSQPIMVEGTVPIKTTSLGDIAEYGKGEPRVLMLSRVESQDYLHLNISMRYRELRSSTPKGYLIALCPVGRPACDGSISGGSEIRIWYDKTMIVTRDITQGGDMTVTYLKAQVG